MELANERMLIMRPTFGLTEERINSQLAPLGALTYYWQREQLLDPLFSIDIKMKKREFSPQDKLIQVLISILSGCEQLYKSPIPAHSGNNGGIPGVSST